MIKRANETHRARQARAELWAVEHHIEQCIRFWRGTWSGPGSGKMLQLCLGSLPARELELWQTIQRERLRLAVEGIPS